MTIKRFRKLTSPAIGLAAILLFAGTAFAQYGGGGTGGTMGTPTSSGTYAPGTPGYGHGKAIGIGVGAAAAGVGAVYFFTHRGSTITGCTEMADDGLRLTDDKSKKTLAILPGPNNVKAGERVELKGKIKKNSAGDQNFLVKKVAKDFGQCRTQGNAAAGNSLSSQVK
jgi:hypothetical protein